MNQPLDDSNNKNRKIKIKKILKIIFVIFLLIIDNKLKLTENKNIFKKYQRNPKLNYYFINIEKYKDIIKLVEGGILEIYKNYNNETNNYQSEESQINNNEKSGTVFLIIPGGSYAKVSPREGLPIAKKFYSYGYSVSVLNYSVYPAHYPTNYNQGLQALKILSSKFKKIIMVGFSAGGHLAGFLGTSGKKNIYNTVGMILCYPVISFLENAHIPSRKNFCGEKRNSAKYWNKFSIDKRVNKETVPTFIWTIKNDKIVPYENSLFMIDSLKKNKIEYKAEIFENGLHGMALADEFCIVGYINKNCINDNVAIWPDLAVNFVENLFKK